MMTRVVIRTSITAMTMIMVRMAVLVHVEDNSFIFVSCVVQSYSGTELAPSRNGIMNVFDKTCSV